MAEESSDGVGGMKILHDSGSPSPRDGGVCGSAAWSSDGSSFLCCGGVRSADGVRGSSTDGVRGWNTPCAGFLPLGAGCHVRQAIGGDLALAMPHSEVGMLTGVVMACDIESRDRDREVDGSGIGTCGPEERKRLIVSFCELPRTRASYDVCPSAAKRLESNWIAS